VITRFPAEKLLVAGAHYYTTGGALPTTRELENPPSQDVIGLLAAGARSERVGG
jgi:hypothetical protein